LDTKKSKPYKTLEIPSTKTQK